MEVIDKLSNCKTSVSAKKPEQPNKHKPATITKTPDSPPKKKFKCPMISTENIVEQEDDEEKFIMPRPSYQHQLTNNTSKKPLVDVIVKQHLTNVLKDYQKEGVRFLYSCVMGISSENFKGCILVNMHTSTLLLHINLKLILIQADEMGLGKTLQTITLMFTLLRSGPYSENIAKRVLIVTPSSLVGNWDKEIMKWLKDERIFTFIVDGKKTVENFHQSQKIPIMIVSYEMFLKHSKEIENIKFDLIICDEGHRLKSAELKLNLALTKIDCERRVLLTGTPFQNCIQEFFTLINFVNPGILGSYQEFKTEYELPILYSQQPTATEDQQLEAEQKKQELNDIISKFILRRTQDVIYSHLPKKQEIVVFIKPTKNQQDLTKTLINLYESSENLSKNIQALEMIIYLKKVCNHPHLLQTSTSNKVRELEILKAMFPDLTNQQKSITYSSNFSAKLNVLMDLLSEIKQKHEKVVVVSYSTQALDMLMLLCSKLDYKQIRLDGSTKTSERMKLVEQFNDPESETFVFLLSAKSGGVGLNLIGASRLIIFDMDWNPANDLQAAARIFREGQKKNVFIYRLLTMGTIEEKIYQRQLTKCALSDSVCDIAAVGGGNKFSDDELKELFSTNDEYFNNCQTHYLMDCQCNANGNIPSIVEKDFLDDEVFDNPFDSQFCISKKRPKTVFKLHQLMKYEHHIFPFDETMLKELGLEKCQHLIPFIFRNQSSDIN